MARPTRLARGRGRKPRRTPPALRDRAACSCARSLSIQAAAGVLVVDVAVDAIGAGASRRAPRAAGRAACRPRRRVRRSNRPARAPRSAAPAAAAPCGLRELEEADGGLRRVALAMGAGDDEQILLVLEPARLVVGHVGAFDPDARRPGRLLQRLGEARAVAGLAREQHRQRACRDLDGRWGDGHRLGKGRGHCSGGSRAAWPTPAR